LSERETFMSAPQKTASYITPEGYLALEAAAEIKHEYVDGEIFAMTGVTRAHNIICLNLAALLRDHLRGSRCQTFMAEVKLQVEAANCFFYPDLFVTCSEADRANPLVQAEAKLVIEVLSESTALFDREGKFAAYRSLPSLAEYVLVRQDMMSIECYRRGDGGEWILHPYSEGETVRLHSLELSFPIEAAYPDVDFGIAAAQT